MNRRRPVTGFCIASAPEAAPLYWWFPKAVQVVLAVQHAAFQSAAADTATACLAESWNCVESHCWAVVVLRWVFAPLHFVVSSSQQVDPHVEVPPVQVELPVTPVGVFSHASQVWLAHVACVVVVVVMQQSFEKVADAVAIPCLLLSYTLAVSHEPQPEEQPPNCDVGAKP
jgi:hypothetical protein